MTYLIKSTRYAIKLELGKVVQTSVMIAERISYLVFSADKDPRYLKFGKSALKLHRQMLIILLEDIARMLQDSAIHQLGAGKSSPLDSEYRSGVMDISPRPHLESIESDPVSKGNKGLRVSWIPDLNFLLQNLDMIRVNLAL